jgi:hypothetical protein
MSVFADHFVGLRWIWPGSLVYHFVYHDSRQEPRGSASTLSEQKEKSLIWSDLADISW